MISAAMLACNTPPHHNASNSSPHSSPTCSHIPHPLPPFVLLIYCSPCFSHPLLPLLPSSTTSFALLIHCSFILPPSITGLMLELSRAISVCGEHALQWGVHSVGFSSSGDILAFAHSQPLRSTSPSHCPQSLSFTTIHFLTLLLTRRPTCPATHLHINSIHYISHCSVVWDREEAAVGSLIHWRASNTHVQVQRPAKNMTVGDSKW